MKNYLLKLCIISISLLLIGCPDDEFDIEFQIVNETPNTIYIMYDHQVDFSTSIFPKPTDKYSIPSLGVATYTIQSEWFDQNRILRILIVEERIFANYEWEYILSEELYTRIDLTKEGLQNIDFEVIYNGQ